MKRLISIFLLLLLDFPAYSQGDEFEEQKEGFIEIYFDKGVYALDPTFSDNNNYIQELSNYIDRLQQDNLLSISKIEIDSYTSPEGGRRLNMELSHKRTEAIYSYLIKKKGIPDSLIIKKYSGIAWEQLADLIENSNLPNKEQIARSARYYPEEAWLRGEPTDRWLTLLDSRLKRLQDYNGGRAYKYIEEHFFPLLRKSEVVRIYYTRRTIENKPFEIKTKQKLETIQVKIKEEIEEIKPPFIAIKTNLLFDIFSFINIELEVLIKNRFSVACEWIFPWWTFDDGSSSSDRHRIQLLNGNIEAKYWLGDRSKRSVLTGWYAGLYAGGGLYDFEYDREGYQGEFFIAAGVSAGYAHTINKSGNLRMEYSLGVGYLKTDYRHYESEYYGVDDWRAVRTETGAYTWVGPTKVRASLVWLINRKAKRGGVD